MTAKKTAAAGIQVEHIKGIIANNPDGIVVVDRQGVVLFANPAAARLFERESGSINGHKFKYNIIPGKDTEIEFIKKDGTVSRAEARASDLVVDGQEALLISLRDITSSCLIQEELLDRNTTLSAIFESAPNIMLLVDEDARVTDINRAGIEFAGRDKEDLLGLLGGEVFNCLNSFHGEGCGKNKECTKCPVRSKAMRTLRTQEPIFNEEGEFEILRHGKTFNLHIMISTAPINTVKGKQVLVTITDLTERHRMEEEVKASEEKYHLLMDSVPSAVSIVQHGKIVFANRMTAQLTGYSLEELKVLDGFYIIHRDDRAKVQDFHRRRMQGEAVPDAYSLRIIRKDGTVIWLRRRVVAVDWAGAPALLVMDLDITDRIQAEKTLNEKTNQLEQFFSSPIDLLSISDTAGYFRRLSLAWEKVLGYTVKEIERRLFLEFVHPDDIAATKKAMQRLKKQQQVVDFSNRYRHKDGSYRWILWNSSPVGDDVFSTALDITESKEVRYALEVSETRYRRLFEAAKDGILILNGDTGEIVDVNPFLLQMLGYREKDLLGKELWQIGVFKDIAASRQAFLKLKAEKYIRYDDLPLESRDGRRMAVEFVSNVYKVDSTEVIQCNIRDITARKQAEENYQKLFQKMLDGFALHEIICDGQGIPVDYRFLAVNPAFEAMTGLKANEVVGRTVLEVLPGTEKYWIETYGKVALTGESVEFENYSQVIGKYFNVTAFRPAPNQFAVVFIDVTEQKNAEEKLRQSAAELESRNAFIQAVIDNLPIGLALNTISDGQATYLNHKFEEIYGWPKEDIADILNFFEKVYPDADYRSELMPRVMADIESGDPARMKWRNLTVTTRSGEKRVIDAVNIPIPEQNIMVSTVFDVTAQRQAEEELSKSHELLSNLVRQVPGVVYQYRLYPDGRSSFPYSSPGMNDIYEYSPEEVQEDATPVFGRLHPDDRDRFSQDILESARTLKEFYCEFRVILPKQGLRWRWSQAHPQRMPDGGTLWYGIISDITERKHTEEALKENEEKYRIVADFTHDWEYWIGDDGQFRYMSPSCERLTGYTREEFLHDPKLYSHIVHPKDRHRITDHYEQAAGSDDTEELEFRVIKRDGQERWFSHVCHPVISDDGRYLGRRASNRDVTSRKTAEGEIIERDQRFQQLLADTLEIIQSVGRDGKFRFVNQAWHTLLGYSAEEMSQMTLTDIIHPDCMKQCMTMLKEVLKGKSLRNVEAKFVAKDGSVIEVEGNAEPRYSDGKVIATHGFFRDVTERKQMAQSLQKAAEEWRTTFDSINDMVAIVGANHQVIRVNKAFARVINMESGDIIGRHCYEVIHGMNQPHPSCPHARTLETKKVETSEYFDKKLKLWVEATTSPIFDDNGQLTGSVHIIKDISARKKAEEEEQQLRNKAEMSSRLAAVGEMASGIAHEINNPLTGVIGFSELLLGRPNLPEDMKEELKIINDGSQRVKDIVRRMLTFARQAKPLKSSVSITELIDNTLELRGYVLKTANIEVVRDYDPDLPWVMADAGQLQQVFLNLIVNAEYAMKKAHDKGVLVIKTERLDGYIRISVTDDGTGIPEAVKSRLFQPFFTTKEPGEGTGLGLALSMGIIKEHGGFMKVDSVEGQGTTFIIDLPITAVDENPEVEMPVIETVRAVAGARILTVDDEPTVGALVRTILTGAGHQVTDCRTPQEALDKLRENTYDLIVLDIRMPGMSGIELYDEIKARWPEMTRRVMFLTGDTSDLVTREYLSAHDVPYITKPFERRVLRDKVDDILNEGRRGE